MNKKKSPAKNAGLTMVEVLIAMLIFALIMGGFSNLFLATKRATTRAHSRMAVGKLSGWFLDSLQMYVTQDNWDVPPDPDDPDIGNLLTIPPSGVTGYKTPNNPFDDDDDINLYPNSYYITLNWMNGEPYETYVEPNIYYPVYGVSDIDGLRKVKLTICWQEREEQ